VAARCKPAFTYNEPVAIHREKVLESAQKLIEKRRYDKAVLELRPLLAADPNDTRVMHKIGELQAKQGLWAEAIDTHDSLGKLYERQGFAVKATAVYRQVREMIAAHAPQLEERYGHVPGRLADLYQEQGLNNDALALLNEVAARLQQRQREREATDIYRKIAHLDASNPIPHLRLAEALSREGDVEGAVAGFRTAAGLLVQLERRDDAIQVLERLLHHRPEPDQARLCAELYLARNRPPHDVTQALTKLQICYQANPQDVGALTLIARAFDVIGQAAKAAGVRGEIERLRAR
jgi:tetratricopeptide (TPR) repeat protein